MAGRRAQGLFLEPTGRDPVRVLVGDARTLLGSVPDGVFQCAVTSPPYWGVRDYGHKGQIGAEGILGDYVANVVAVMREVRRTLRADGTLWLNLGNTYTSGGRAWRAPDAKNKGRAMSYRPPTPKGLKPKDLVGVAWQVAMACQADGWYLRNDIIWHKPNCQPESVKDRVTVAHEYLFLLTKSERYRFDHEAVREPRADKGGVRARRSVWSINTEPFPGAHFAVFPAALVRPCLLAGTREGDLVLDPFLGSGTVAQVAAAMGRRCVGLEASPAYAAMALRRLGRGAG
ncbi:MAG TPA: site-specific DNA-methyltransferase [Opitutaceae bacterium]